MFSLYSCEVLKQTPLCILSANIFERGFAESGFICTNFILWYWKQLLSVCPSCTVSVCGQSLKPKQLNLWRHNTLHHHWMLLRRLSLLEPAAVCVCVCVSGEINLTFIVRAQSAPFKRYSVLIGCRGVMRIAKCGFFKSSNSSYCCTHCGCRIFIHLELPSQCLHLKKGCKMCPVVALL